MSGPRYELFSMLAEAASAGMGIALIPRLLIEDELARGTLVQVCRYEHQRDKAYYLIYPEAKSENSIRDWIDGEARQCPRRPG